MREFLNEPMTISHAFSMMFGIVIGKVVFAYIEYRKYKKWSGK